MSLKVFLTLALLVTSSIATSKDDAMDLLEDLLGETEGDADLENRGLLDNVINDDISDDEPLDDEADELARDFEDVERMLSEEPAEANVLAPTKTNVAAKIPFRPKPCIRCCTTSGSYLYTRLNSLKPVVYGSLPGVSLLQRRPPSANGKCDGQMLFKATFERASSNPRCVFCVRQPLCGRTMLKVTLGLSQATTSRSGYMINVGDSISNNGEAGDSNHQSNDAEFQLRNDDGKIFSSDACKRFVYYLTNYLSPKARSLTLYISNNHIALEQYPAVGRKRVYCRNCLFALNGQADPSFGGVNQDIYIALNRVIRFATSRTGRGVCYVRMSWECPISYIRSF